MTELATIASLMALVREKALKFIYSWKPFCEVLAEIGEKSNFGFDLMIVKIYKGFLFIPPFFGEANGHIVLT